MKHSKKKRIISMIIVIVMIISMLSGTVISILADDMKIVTLGADLTQEQRELMLNYFNVNESDVRIITVNNEDEHKYLDGIATSSQIGTRTTSCTYIEPTSEGGIHIKTVNLNWVTSDMIRNALVTSGINNCNIVCVSPKEVSGTGALSGIFKAYEDISGDELSDEKIELAAQELVQTMDIAETVGQDNAASIMGDIKEIIIGEGIVDSDEIQNKVTEYLNSNEVKLSEEQTDLLIQLMLDISKQEYSVEDVKNAYKDIKETVSDIKEAADSAKNFLDKAFTFIKDTWYKITGVYDSIMETEEAQLVKEQIGILANTNDNLLGDNTVVTVTEENDIIETVEKAVEEENKQEEKAGFFGTIKNFFSDLFGDKQEDIFTQEAENVDNNITFDNVEIPEEQLEDEIIDEVEEIEQQKDEEIFKVLEYVTYEMQNQDTEITEGSGSPTLDDIIK